MNIKEEGSVRVIAGLWADPCSVNTVCVRALVCVLVYLYRGG